MHFVEFVAPNKHHVTELPSAPPGQDFQTLWVCVQNLSCNFLLSSVTLAREN